MSIHEMTESQKSEFLAAFRAKFGFAELTASANADAHAMLSAAAWAWQASRKYAGGDLSYAVLLHERAHFKAENEALRAARTIDLPKPLPSGDYRMTAPFYKAADIIEALSAAGIEVKA